MSKLVKILTKVLQQLHTEIAASQAQLTAQQNPEALHHLRVSLRQLRSLLRPLRPHLDEAMRLDRLVKKNMTLTNAIRDLEVLITELKAQDMNDLALVYQKRLSLALLNLGQKLELDSILLWLTVLPGYWRQALTKRTAQDLELHIGLQWRAQSHKLLKLIRQKTPDKHDLRIIIKQLRYNSESYHAIFPKRAKTLTQQLKHLQEVLGTWHDYLIWLIYAESHTELQALIPRWRQQLQHWEHESDQALKKLRRSVLL